MTELVDGPGLDQEQLTRSTILTGAQEAEVHRIVRQEIASLAGLALRRLQDENFTRSIQGNIAAQKSKEVAGHLWGEVLAEYGRDS